MSSLTLSVTWLSCKKCKTVRDFSKNKHKHKPKHNRTWKPNWFLRKAKIKQDLPAKLFSANTRGKLAFRISVEISNLETLRVWCWKCENNTLTIFARFCSSDLACLSTRSSLHNVDGDRFLSYLFSDSSKMAVAGKTNDVTDAVATSICCQKEIFSYMKTFFFFFKNKWNSFQLLCSECRLWQFSPLFFSFFLVVRHLHKKQWFSKKIHVTTSTKLFEKRTLQMWAQLFPEKNNCWHTEHGKRHLKSKEKKEL